MYESMRIVEHNKQKKVECLYAYRDNIEEVFAPQNSTKGNNSVIKCLLRFGRLDEFKTQVYDMVSMGTLVPLTDEKIANLETKAHHSNKLSFTPIIYLRFNTAWCSPGLNQQIVMQVEFSV